MPLEASTSKASATSSIIDVPWQPDDYIHRIGRTGRAGMKGIAITLASREDGESIDRIEKLIGHKIPVAGVSEEARAEKPPAPEKRAKTKKTPRAAAPKADLPKRARAARDRGESSPVVEDIKSDWNGPLPGFLSVGAS